MRNLPGLRQRGEAKSGFRKVDAPLSQYNERGHFKIKHKGWTYVILRVDDPSPYGTSLCRSYTSGDPALVVVGDVYNAFLPGFREMYNQVILEQTL